MSEFHKAFYTTCIIHKKVEHPKWRKCWKCEILKMCKTIGEIKIALKLWKIRSL